MEQEQLTDQQAVRIGILTGLIVYVLLSILIYALVTAGIVGFVWFEYFYVPYFVCTTVGWPAIPGGIGGALLGTKWKKNQKAAWIGGWVGAISTLLVMGLLNGAWVSLFTRGLYFYPE